MPQALQPLTHVSTGQGREEFHTEVSRGAVGVGCRSTCRARPSPEGVGMGIGSRARRRCTPAAARRPARRATSSWRTTGSPSSTSTTAVWECRRSTSRSRRFTCAAAARRWSRPCRPGMPRRHPCPRSIPRTPILLALAVNVLARPERRIAVTAEAQGRHEVSNGSSDRMTMAEDSVLLLVRPATVDARSSDGAPVLRSAVE